MIDFEPFYAPLPNLEAYLSRIGYTGPVRPDLETLNALVRAQLTHVPFENLDVYDAGVDVPLDTASLFDKIVTRRRGGYCFELNALFYTLLKDIGFDCYPVAVRVVWMSKRRLTPLTHRATIITIDGTRYFADVGFGGPAPHDALELDNPAEQMSDGQRFIFDKSAGDTVLCHMTENGPERLLQFSETPYDPIDFLALNEYQSKSKMSGFKMVRMVNITRPDGSISITGNVMRTHKNGEVTETVLSTQDELRAALRDHFGIDVDFELKV
jgi:N-hydroxyarylamine O-acetyltransferase